MTAGAPHEGQAVSGPSDSHGGHKAAGVEGGSCAAAGVAGRGGSGALASWAGCEVVGGGYGKAVDTRGAGRGQAGGGGDAGPASSAARAKHASTDDTRHADTSTLGRRRACSRMGGYEQRDARLTRRGGGGGAAHAGARSGLAAASTRSGDVHTPA